MLKIYLKADYGSMYTFHLKTETTKRKVLQKSVITTFQSDPGNVSLNLCKINLIYLGKLKWRLLPSNSRWLGWFEPACGQCCIQWTCLEECHSLTELHRKPKHLAYPETLPFSFKWGCHFKACVNEIYIFLVTCLSTSCSAVKINYS